MPVLIKVKEEDKQDLDITNKEEVFKWIEHN
jgi:hypothetical protein